MAKMTILGEQEIKTYDYPPDFKNKDRKQFLTLPTALQKHLFSFRTDTSQVCFHLTFGYFKACGRFFSPTRFREKDIEFVCRRMGIFSYAVDKNAYDAATFYRHKRLVLQYFNYHLFESQTHAPLLQTAVSKMIQSQFRPKLIFNFMLDWLRQKRIELPTYHSLQNIILEAIKAYDDSLRTLLEDHLKEEHKAALDKLMERKESASYQPYPITILKYFDPTDSNKSIQGNIEKLLLIQEVYKVIHPLIDALQLNGDAIRYYGELVIHYQVHQLSRREPYSKYLYLLAFVAYQLYQFEDALVDTLLLQCKHIFNQIRKTHKEQELGFYDLNKPTINHLIGDYQSSIERDEEVISLLWSEQSKFTPIQIIDRLRELFPRNQEQELSGNKQLVKQWKQQYNHQDKNAYYNIVASYSLRLQKKVAAIIKALQFNKTTSDKHLMEAIKEFKDKDGAVTKTVALEFLSEKEKAAVLGADGKNFKISLFKALFFDAICQSIKAGTLNLSHSYRYKAFDEYLINKMLWKEDKDLLLARAECSYLKSYEEVISPLKQETEQAYESTNQSILLGENTLMRFRGDGKFSITTPKVEQAEAEKLVDFFPNAQIIPLSQVLATVQHLTNYLNQLVHLQNKYQKARPRHALFYAGIMAYGCNVGIPTMTKVTTPMSETELENTCSAYFSLANVNKANDSILKFTNQLELPQIYKRYKDQLHTSSDGQKIGVKGNSIYSAYSYKYFKKGRGASVYSFGDERAFLWDSTVINSFEREATYVIDGLMHNEIVQSTIHSTDTHGYTEAVFGLMNLLGFEFAPRIAKLYKQQLYAFTKNAEYTQKGYKILPNGYINTELIKDNWDNLLRLITSIKLKECTASQIFQRLNSYSRQHPVYKALKEYGKIIKTLFILKYIDDVELRQAIRKQLNKIEQANRLSYVVRFANNGESIFPTRQEQLVAESCTRLIKNAIICWNYLYLTNQIQQAPSEQRKKEIIQAVKAGSVIAWQHIYFHGLYDFSDEKLVDAFDLLSFQNTNLNLEQLMG